MPLFKISSQTWFRDESYSTVCATVFVEAEEGADAEVLAIDAFKEGLLLYDHSFEELQAMSDEERKAAFKEDVGLKSLYDAAAGDVDIRKCVEGVSEVVYR